MKQMAQHPPIIEISDDEDVEVLDSSSAASNSGKFFVFNDLKSYGSVDLVPIGTR